MTIKLLTGKELDSYVEEISFVKNSRTQKEADGWRKYFKKDHALVLADNGEHRAVIEFDRPSISRDIWYDDETPNPLGNGADKKQVFIDYNLDRNFGTWGFEGWLNRRKREANEADPYDPPNPPYIELDTKDPTRVHIGYFWSEVDDGKERYFLTPDETRQLERIVNDLKAAYIKRLESYYKRYSNKIWAHGYWRDR